MLNRRRLICAGALLIAPQAWAAAPAGGRLRFDVFRGGKRIGEHVMSFTRTGPTLLVVTEATMVIRLGPIPAFRYSHRAREEWRDGRFLALETSTSSNGKRESVTARRHEGEVRIETRTGALTAAADASPLTHWNSGVLDGPLFNPQTGRNLKVVASRRPGAPADPVPGKPPATGWSLRGEAEIDNWYDDAGVWLALRGRLPDKSNMEYRRA
jgi:hypothetical protein